MANGTMAALAILLVLLIALAALLARPLLRRRRLRTRFGPEYDRAVERAGGRTEGERDLLDREREHRDLPLRELTPEARARHTAEWEAVQEEFVDRPEAAVAHADDLVTRVMRDRGYPTDGPEARLRILSVEHAHTLDGYRHAAAVRTGGAAAGPEQTEDLRAALLHYRTLFRELTATSGPAHAEKHAPRADRPRAA
ncbi:hypothetical protein ACN20G_25085 [Streptomyces sp. BI20]|uniref:hypothetical protein n=1 Tax=Streptomyces sp. BI20 TaxID=3403460 RepID=UPI003C75202E